MSAIDLRSVAKAFGATKVLKDVNLTVREGSITAILGDSGSGKTTLLRLMAGFEHVDSGTVAIGDRIVDDSHKSVRAQHRGVGYVPQEGALFPHLTVLKNIGFGLTRHERAAALDLLEMVGLSGLGRRYPHQLSGGQQQRVALARALAIRPKVVLLDEPFSSLDASLRASVRADVARIVGKLGTTTVIVTHDQDEALAMADQIAVLSDGRVVASDGPRQLYTDPPDVTAATSIGEANVLAAVTSGHVAVCVLGTVGLRPSDDPAVDGPSRLLLRPEQLVLSDTAVSGATLATVVDFQYHGHDAMAQISLEDDADGTLLARVSGDQQLASGQKVWVQVSGSGLAWPDRDDQAGSPGS